MDHSPGEDRYEPQGSVYEEEEEVPEPEFSLGRDGRTRWYSSRPSAGKAKVQSVHYPGVQGAAEHATGAYDCWRLFFGDILDSIVTYTNTYIALSQEEAARGEEATCRRPTCVTELEAFIGLLYLCGIYKSDGMSTAELWRKDGTGVELFPYTMHHNRFCFLLDAIQFDDVRTRAERKASDKLAAVRDLLDLFVDNCQKHYCVSDLVFVTERHEPFRGRCSFKQYLPGTRRRYGLRLHAALDAVMFYTFNLEVDVPNQVAGVYQLDAGFNQRVLRLSEPALCDGRCVIVETPATFKLARKLLAKRTYLVARLDAAEPEIPEHFVTGVTSRAAYTEDATLVSVPKKSHASVLLSTRPNEAAADLPQFLSVVSRMVRSVHAQDACVRLVSGEHTRWPVVLFVSLLNIASQNALILARCGGQEVASRTDFVRELAARLVHAHLVSHMHNPGLAFVVKTRISKITRQEIPMQALQFSADEAGGGGVAYRCHECPTRRKKKTKNVCKDCKKPLCLEHLVKICEACYLRGGAGQPPAAAPADAAMF